jgi:putative oxidoreductase
VIGRPSFLLEFCINKIIAMKKIFSTDQSLAPFLLRLFLAFVLFPHGAQKLLGWFGGFGFDGTMTYFTETVKLPWIIGFAVILIEFFGPIALLLGFAVRLWSFVIAIVMTGIILTHFTDYFFMNWFGNQKTEGMEFFLLVIGITGALMYSGAGRLSIDAGLQKTSAMSGIR